MNKSDVSSRVTACDARGVSRRSFLSAGAAGSAVLLTGGLTSLLPAPALAAAEFPLEEATIAQLQAAMASGRLTSREPGARLPESDRGTEPDAARGDRNESERRGDRRRAR